MVRVFIDCLLNVASNLCRELRFVSRFPVHVSVHLPSVPRLRCWAPLYHKMLGKLPNPKPNPAALKQAADAMAQRARLGLAAGEACLRCGLNPNSSTLCASCSFFPREKSSTGSCKAMFLALYADKSLPASFRRYARPSSCFSRATATEGVQQAP